MKNYFKISAIVILVMAAFFCRPPVLLAQSDSGQVNVSVRVTAEVFCNNNGICEPALGENELNCFNDCGCNNNGICEPQRGEDSSNCPADCNPVPAFTITYTAGANGAITGPNPQIVNQGSDGVQVTAVANAGYHFTNWSDGSIIASRTETNVQGNINLTASFAADIIPPPTTFTLTYTAGNGGTITGHDRQTINQGSDGVQVTAVANAGYHFTNWSDGLTAASRTDKNIQGNINLTAYFSASAGGGNALLLLAGLYIKNLEISKITFDSAELSWQTSKSALCTTYIGETSEYEKQIISEAGFFTGHSSELTGLSPSAVYHFNIICKAAGNLSAQTGDKYFTTLYVISNVNNFTAVAGKEEIYLSWENPADPNFQSVRLVRSENFYPASINDGTILYEGSAQFFTDKNVEIKKGYYYAIFAQGKNGSWSSGALAFAQIQPAQTPVIPITPVTPVTPQLKKLKLSDFDFYSGTEKIPVINDKTVKPEANESLIVSIDYEKVPASYKEMFFALDAGKNRFYYLFQLNKEKTVYSVKLVSPLGIKTYPLTISFLDQNNKLLYEINGEISVWKNQPAFSINILLILIIILILLILFLLVERKKKKNKR